MNASEFTIRVCGPEEIESRIGAWEAWYEGRGVGSLSYHPRWLAVLRDGLGHAPYCVEATSGERVVGLLPLTLVKSCLFGRFLVGLPYLNVGGVAAASPDIAVALLDHAAALADRLDVKHLELRHEAEVAHPALTQRLASKVHMRLPLPAESGQLWDAFKPGVRNQIRKGQKQEFTVSWGGQERLDDFYAVFSRNMRDLGTPVFGRGLFRCVLREFRERAEFCVVYAGRRPVAAAMLCHGREVSEVPSASSLREFNSTNANMLMYWELLRRAIERGQQTFDFGRSSIDSNTYRFKKQWGAQPHSAIWQYYVRRGEVGDMRPDNKKYRLAIRLWQRLPLPLANALGPAIVRGIP